ncbi:MAG: 1-deoxy-D-xylulose-5-phosphate synthase [Solirubrobacterales bacterium]|nr:1-deoxy-D-xylulose-5-phosphate synthase [Solirubrobacterales bacterium]
MRAAFADELLRQARTDDRIVLLTGDLGFGVLERFADELPERFFNVGVAEQNMVGIATGLAEAGFVPFAYSIATFASMRGYEFLRNGAALHELPVRIVGMGGGLDYGHNGVTHYALEDVGIMRVQPSVTVIAPADADQARAALDATMDLPGPAYFRLSKEGPAVPGLDGRFALGEAATIGDGEDVALIALGTMAGAAVEASEQLAARGVGSTVVVVSSFNPSPIDDLTAVLRRVPLAISVEAHYVNGGVGSLVAEVIAERGLGCQLIRRGLEEMPRGVTGSPAYLYERFGLSPALLAEAAFEALGVVV